MIKDIIVNLEYKIVRDPTRDFAISIAETFDAHVAGIAFAHAPDFPGYVMLEIPSDILAQMIAESEKQLGVGGAPADQGDRGGGARDFVDSRPALRSQRVHGIRT